MKTKNAKYWIEKLELAPHPEGGYFRETYRSSASISFAALPFGFSSERSISTAIYFLLDKRQCSSFHRIRSDELWHFHEGGSLCLYIIEKDGGLRTLRLGNDIENGDFFQVVVPAGCWFGAELIDKATFCLCGCTVAPGFAFEDFELAKVDELSQQYPRHRDLIHKLGGNFF